MQNDFFAAAAAVAAAAWQVKARIFNVKRGKQHNCKMDAKEGQGGSRQRGTLQGSRRACGHASMTFSAIELNYVKN